MIAKTASVLIIVYIALVSLQCSDNATNLQSFELDEAIQLSPGESIVINSASLSLTFERIDFDTRCITSPDCGFQGLAEIEVTIRLHDTSPCTLALAISSVPNANDIEFYSVDTLGFRFRLLELSPKVSSVALGSGNSVANSVASIEVSLLNAAIPKPVSKVFFSDSPLESIQAAKYEIRNAEISGDTLTLSIEYAGGCRRHYFRLVMCPGSFDSSVPPQANFYLFHFDTNDNCEALISEKLRFDISDVKQMYEQIFSSPLSVLLNVYQDSGTPGTNPLHVFYGSAIEVNHSPELMAVVDTSLFEGELVVLRILTSDPDGDVPIIFALDLPPNCSFTDNNAGTGFLTFRPDFSQSGEYAIEIVAADSELADTISIHIRVANVNRRPVIAPISNQTVRYMSTLNLSLNANDIDGDSLRLWIEGLPLNSAFSQLTNSAGRLEFNPDQQQIGIINLLAIASDGLLADSSVFSITVLPALTLEFASLDPQVVSEGSSLEFSLTVAVSEQQHISYTVSCDEKIEPFVKLEPNGHQVKCTVTPDFTSAGEYTLRFHASVENVSASLDVFLEVLESGNQAPIWQPRSDYESVVAGKTLTFDLVATDPDGVAPILSTQNLPAGATFTITKPGTGRFEFITSEASVGHHSLEFKATDSEDALICSFRQIKLNIDTPQLSSGSLMPAALGNYWIVEKTSTEECFTGFLSDPPSVHYPMAGTVSQDSIWIVDQVTFEGYTWWRLSEPLEGLGQIFRESNDTIYASSVVGTDTRIFYPVASSIPAFPNSIFVGAISAPAGAYAVGYSFGGGYRDIPTRYATSLVPGVGFLFYEYHEYCPFPHTCDQFGGCNYMRATKLLRFGRQ